MDEKMDKELTPVEETETVEVHYKEMSPTQMVMRRFFRSRLSLVGLIMLVALFVFSFAGPPVMHLFGYQWYETDTDRTPTVKRAGYWIDGTDANGQEVTYTGVSTTYKFLNTGAPARAINIDTSINTDMSPEAFFAAVQTPDTISEAGTTYTLSFSVGSGTAIDDMEYPAGSLVTLPTPTYTGHTFLGWYTDVGLTAGPVTKIAMTKDNITVYAKWSA